MMAWLILPLAHYLDCIILPLTVTIVFTLLLGGEIKVYFQDMGGGIYPPPFYKTDDLSRNTHIYRADCRQLPVTKTVVTRVKL